MSRLSHGCTSGQGRWILEGLHTRACSGQNLGDKKSSAGSGASSRDPELLSSVFSIFPLEAHGVGLASLVCHSP